MRKQIDIVCHNVGKFDQINAQKNSNSSLEMKNSNNFIPFTHSFLHQNLGWGSSSPTWGLHEVRQKLGQEDEMYRRIDKLAGGQT